MQFYLIALHNIATKPMFCSKIQKENNEVIWIFNFMEGNVVVNSTIHNPYFTS